MMSDAETAAETAPAETAPAEVVPRVLDEALQGNVDQGLGPGPTTTPEDPEPSEESQQNNAESQQTLLVCEMC